LAYKWLKRFNNDGLDGLKDRHRSGRPPDVPKEKLSKIRSELSESPSGWKAKEIMDIIYKRTGVRYHHEVHVYGLLHKWGFKPKVPQRRFVNIASKEEKEQFKKGREGNLKHT
jgi:transposase